MSRPLLCKLGFHVPSKGIWLENRGRYNKCVTSRSAYCMRCGKKLYLVDKHGEKIEDETK